MADDLTDYWGPALSTTRPAPIVAPMPMLVPAEPARQGRPPVAISEEQLGRALANGWSVRDIGIKLGCSETTLRKRIAAARQVHGPLWGAGAPEQAEDPAELLRMRLSSPPPSPEATAALARHAIHWGLETGTKDSASIVRAALAVAESPMFRTTESVESEDERRRRLLEMVIRGLTGAPL